MSENIDGKDLFGSGDHIWDWGPVDQAFKDVRTVGTAGQASWAIQTGPRPGRITGHGGPAVLKTDGHNSLFLADAAMDSLVAAIENICKSGKVCQWEDDRDRTGDQLQVRQFRRVGARRYTHQGIKWGVWFEYECLVLELSGGGRQ